VHRLRKTRLRTRILREGLLALASPYREEQRLLSSSKQHLQVLPSDMSSCFPLEENIEWRPEGATCAVCGQPAFGKAYFSRAY